MLLDISNNGKDDYLNRKSYQDARSERLKIDDFTCQCCGSKRNLEVHHINRENNDAPDARKDLITLCRECHRRVEDTIRDKKFPTGQFWFTVISADIDHYGGSEKMEPCNRLKIKLLVYDSGSPFARYVGDNLPLLDRFVWKWREFIASIGLDDKVIDEDTIAFKVIGKRGICNLAVRQGDLGQYNSVEHYIENVSKDDDVPF